MPDNGIANIQIPRVIICGTSVNVGVSTVVLGLLVALKRSGTAVAALKVGNSLTNTTYQRRITGHLGHSLDLNILNKQQVIESIARASSGAELLVIEGEKGLFDYQGSNSSFSCIADLARETSTPIILVGDASNYEESFAASMSGFLTYDNSVRVSGVIANRVKDKNHGRRIRHSMEKLPTANYLGAIHVGDLPSLGSSFADANQGNLSLLPRKTIMTAGALVKDGLNMELLSDIATLSAPLAVSASALGSQERRVTIAVADDAAFHLTIQDNLDLMRRSGAQIVAFSPLTDFDLPESVGGVYLSGGYVHLYAADLEKNISMRQNLRRFIQSGGVVYAESAALAYLTQQLQLSDGKVYDMVGALPVTAKATMSETEASSYAYCDVTVTKSTFLADVGQRMRAIRDSRWFIVGQEDVEHCFALRPLPIDDKFENTDSPEQAVDGDSLSRLTSVKSKPSLRGVKAVDDIISLDGYSYSSNILATSMHIHWGAYPQLAQRFVDAAHRAAFSMGA